MIFCSICSIYLLNVFQKTHASAVATRDLARQNQHRREVALLSEAKERERTLIDRRKTADDRKNYFESMERHMFATRSSVKVSYVYTQSIRVVWIQLFNSLIVVNLNQIIN